MDYISIEEHREFSRRIEQDIADLKAEIKEIKSLTISVERLSLSMERTTEEIKRQGEAIRALENASGDTWKKLTYEVIKWGVLLLLAILAQKIGATI